jgi:RHS repeat-associated protein
VGNRTSSHLSANYYYNAANRLTEDDTYDYTYDANGNLTQRTVKPDQETLKFYYNAENQLTKIEKLEHPTSSPYSTITYSYDGLGRRIQKNIDGTKTKWVYDNEDISQEYDGSNNVTGKFTNGPGIDEPISLTRGTSTYFYHSDGLGSVRKMTNIDGGVVNSYTYDSFGRDIAHTITVSNPYRYTGREWDDESGLYYYRARYYDASVGRFLSEDPAGLINGPNLYLYVRNNPLNLIDPWGLNATCPPHDFWQCMSDCVERWRFSNIYTFAGQSVNAAINKLFGWTPRGGFGIGRHPSSWQHKFGLWLEKLTGLRVFDKAGKLAGRAAVGLTIFEGFYDIGMIGRCSVECAQ